MNCFEQDKNMEFGRSIIEGVEIKLCRKSPHAYKPHVHNELSLGFIIDGSTELTMNDRTIRYVLGDGVMIPPLMTHRCAPNDIDHWAYIMLYIDPSLYHNAVSFNQAKKLVGNQSRKLISFIEQLLIEKHPDSLENILIELLLEFGDNEITDTSTANTSDIMKEIHDYILNHGKEEITLEKLQHISGLNKFLIIRNFKKQYMTTPAAFHLQYRVAEAKRLLSKGAEVLDVCEEFRFYDQAHLIREFKKMYGITPGSYMEQIKS